MLDNRLVVGIDFGTTYSGICWAHSARPQSRYPVQTWPTHVDGGSFHSKKVPSKLYRPGQGQKPLWGFMTKDVEDQSKVDQWFKLGLDNKFPTSILDFARYVDSREARILLQTYMEALIAHLIHIINQGMYKGMAESMAFDYVFTVPAIWSDAARAATETSCRAAMKKFDHGNSRILMISEPEAAALYAFEALEPIDIEVGETFMIVDAGGGTVDLITYCVKGLKPLKIDEACPGSGDLCGSSYINRSFEVWIHDKLCDDPGWDNDMHEQVIASFESLKVDFNPHGNSRRYMLDVAGLYHPQQYGVKNRKLEISADQMKAFFTYSVQGTIDLVKGQMANFQVKNIIMVGGFGQSVYLKKSIEDAFPKCLVVVAPDTVGAVCQGATMHGLNSLPSCNSGVIVASRRARAHFGIELGEKFDAVIHEKYAHTKFWDPFYGMHRIRMMHWFIKKNDIVREQEPQEIHFTKNFKPLTAQIFNCLDLKILRNGVDNTAPKQENENTKYLCSLNDKAKKLPMSQLPLKKGRDGNMYYCVDGYVTVTYKSANTQYELFLQNKSFGIVEEEYP